MDEGDGSVRHPSSKGAMSSTGMRIAMGLVRATPSWEWVGADLAPLLRARHEVRFVSNYDEIAALDADWLVSIKFPPSADVVCACKRRGTRVLYFPVDYFTSPAEIAGHANLLSLFDVVAVHARPLADALAVHSRRVTIVEHYCKYALPTPNAYRADGFVLWVGHRQYVVHLGDWLMAHPLEAPLRILTNVPRRLELAGRGASVLARATWFQWSEHAQEALFRSARAAIDIKGSDFSQRIKPPTKAQQFVASGIPIALNADSYGFQYFRSLGFEVATPNDPARWFSEAYWRETVEFASVLRNRTSKEAVAHSYAEILEDT
jgi:hypothetical protein